MLGSLITRPVRFATRPVWLATRLTLWSAKTSLEIAGEVIGFITGHDQDGHHDQSGRGPAGPEPAAWQGAGASSTSSPADAPPAPSAGRGRKSGGSQRRSSAPTTNGSGSSATATAETAAPGRTTEPDRPAEVPQPRDEEVVEAEVAEVLESDHGPVVEYDTPAAAEPAHVSEEPELVEEVSEPGAEDGAGAELHIAEPWEGYRTMRAQDIVERLGSAGREELAAVELYEMSARKRKSILTAAERLLKQASPPR